MSDTELVIPPHSLWLTSVEEDNRNVCVVARNNSSEPVEFQFRISAPEGVWIRCLNDSEDGFEESEYLYTEKVEPERQAPVEFSFVYRDSEHSDDETVVAEITDGEKKLTRELETKLFEN